MQNSDPVKDYEEALRKAMKDPVAFAKAFLDFKPFPYQEEFLRDDSPLIAACCGRQVGKTTLAAIKALHYALFTSQVRVVIVSAALRQSTILFDKIRELSDAAIPARVLLDYRTRTKIRFEHGSEIVALPCGRDGSTLRGFTADMCILDECNFIPEVVINSVVRPMTITRPNAKLIMLSTPWMRDHPFYDAITKPEQGFKTYTWPSSKNPLITEKKLKQDREAFGELDFNREYNAVFLDDQFSYFPSKLTLDSTDDYELHPEPKPGENKKGEYYIGIDLGKHRDPSAIAITQEQPDHTLRLVYLHEFKLETPYMTVIGHIRQLNDQYKFRRGYLDQTGVGEAPYEEIREFAPTIRGITLTPRSKEDILGKLKLTMERKDVTIPREPNRLLTQLTQQRCEPTPQGTLKFSHPTGTHDDLAWAFALSVYAYRGSTDWMTVAYGVRRP